MTKKKSKTIRARRTQPERKRRPTAATNELVAATVPLSDRELRDHFAACALAGGMRSYFDGEQVHVWQDYDDFADSCFNMADAMMRRRQRA